MGYYSDKTWYVGSITLKYYPYVLLLLLMMRILSTIFAYSPQDDSRFIFYEYSERVSREPQNSTRFCFFFVRFKIGSQTHNDHYYFYVYLEHL